LNPSIVVIIPWLYGKLPHGHSGALQDGFNVHECIIEPLPGLTSHYIHAFIGVAKMEKFVHVIHDHFWPLGIGIITHATVAF
jgi:hypothetical protein